VTFALGAVGVHGPVHQIAVANGHAFGVSGDPNDLGHVFHYCDETGLREAGRLFFKPADGPVFSSTQPVKVAVSPDASRVAFGVADELGCLYIYNQIKIA
jgi:malonyl CoA-acyl carrier protein transacylase